MTSAPASGPAPAAMATSDRRVRWQCRRGMKELDVLLERYMDRRYATAPEAERESFRKLLDIDDPTLWHWLSGAAAVPDPCFEGIVGRLRGRG